MLTSPPDRSELDRARARHDDVVRRGHQIKRRRTTALSAAVLAVAVLAVALPLTLSRGSGPGRQVVTTSPPPSPSTSGATAPTTGGHPGATTPTTAPPLARGQEASRSEIPWSQVGEGWTVALWSPAPGAGPGDSTPTANEAQTLFLVNPIGGRYRIATFARTTTVADWSADSRVALLEDTSADAVPLQIVDLTTGAARTVPAAISSYTAPAQLSRPGGRAVLVGHSEELPSGHIALSLERLGLDGAHQLTYPGTFPQVGAFSGSWISSADGTELVLGADRGMAVVGNDGHVVRTLSVPAGGSAVTSSSCRPARWFDARTVVAQCGSGLMLVPMDGGSPRALTVDQTKAGRDLGDLDAWAVGSTTYVQATGGCGYVYLATVDPDGTTTPVDVPGVVSGDSEFVLGVASGRIEVQATVACGSGKSLLWYDPASKTSQVILGPPLDGGGVTSAVLYGQPPIP